MAVIDIIRFKFDVEVFEYSAQPYFLLLGIFHYIAPYARPMGGISVLTKATACVFVSTDTYDR